MTETLDCGGSGCALQVDALKPVQALGLVGRGTRLDHARDWTTGPLRDAVVAGMDSLRPLLA
jgi:hypothetical protein